MTTWQILRNNRGYIWFACGVFFLGWLLGALFPEQLHKTVSSSIDHIREIAQKTDVEKSPLYTSWVILLNNMRAALIMLLVGIPLCFSTVTALLVNGMLIGVVFGEVGQHAEVSYWQTIVFGLLPHGIFELTAIFIASAFGVKLGRVLLVPLREKTRLASFGMVWIEIARVAWVVVVLLVMAAAIEGMVTPLLLNKFVAHGG